MSERPTRQHLARTAARLDETGAGMTFVLLLTGALLMAGALAATLLLAGAVLVDPRWLHLAWAAPVVALLEALARRHRSRARARFGQAEALGRLVEGAWPASRTLRALASCWALLMLAVACARPQWGAAEETIQRAGSDVWVLVDTSKSMLADDMKPSRLARAKLAVSGLLDRLPADRVGLIAFAGEARVACPLTLDHGSLELFLDVLEPDTLQVPGTALAAALDLVGRSLSMSQGRSVAVVLVTDGEDHQGDVERAAQDLARSGVVVHAVGIGRPEGIPLREQGADGTLSYHEDEKGQAVITRLDVATLQQVTAATGGVFAQASSTEIELAAIGSAIENAGSRSMASSRSRVRPEKAWPFMAGAFCLLALAALLPEGASFRRARRRGAGAGSPHERIAA